MQNTKSNIYKLQRH